MASTTRLNHVTTEIEVSVPPMCMIFFRSIDNVTVKFRYRTTFMLTVNSAESPIINLVVTISRALSTLASKRDLHGVAAL